MVREKVRAAAPWFVYSFQELMDQIGPLKNGEVKSRDCMLQDGLFRNGAAYAVMDGFNGEEPILPKSKNGALK